MRSYGLEVLVNGKTVRLVLDTGAAGIVLSHPAAEQGRPGAGGRCDGARDWRQHQS